MDVVHGRVWPSWQLYNRFIWIVSCEYWVKVVIKHVSFILWVWDCSTVFLQWWNAHIIRSSMFYEWPEPFHCTVLIRVFLVWRDNSFDMLLWVLFFISLILCSSALLHNSKDTPRSGSLYFDVNSASFSDYVKRFKSFFSTYFVVLYLLFLKTNEKLKEY